MKFRGALLATALMALPLAAANAQEPSTGYSPSGTVAPVGPVNGPYVAGGVGANWLWKEHINGSAVTNSGGVVYTNTGEFRSTVGGMVLGSVGWGFGNGLRAEGEVSYRGGNSFNHPSGFSYPLTVGGTEQKLGGMFNVMYDFFQISPWVQPYIGVGVGMMSTKIESFYINTVNNNSIFRQGDAQGQNSFAYQFILGAAIPVGGVPGLSVTGDVRFLGLEGNRSYSGTYGGVNPHIGSITSTQNFNTSLLVGFRYAFRTPPAPLPPPPPVEGPKTFLVFFDWNKADLTPQGAAIVADAAQYASSGKYTRIDVDGNTDTTGSASYNMGLSERRARTVAAALVAKGVPQSSISIHAFGDTRLLVPTGPDVREPQNRRVEIIFH